MDAPRRAGTTLALALALAVLAAPMPGAAFAQIARCAAIADDRERLACYDALAASQSAAPAEPTREAQPTPLQPQPQARAQEDATELERQWQLRPDLRRGAFHLAPYRPVYALLRATTRVNSDPQSPTHPLDPRDIDLDRVEAKLQLSFKAKLVEDLLGSDLWFGYTQQSYWQAANGRYSSPFRETNYQPELIVLRPLGLALGPVALRYAGLSFVHESNGRGASLSRSWNRIVGELALESGAWSLHLRPWARVSEPSDERDDNPDIEDFVGRGEIIAVYRSGGHVVTLTGRHTLRDGDRSRGSARLDWAFPLAGALNGHLQLFTGYGESLVDYNHSQTTIGVGLSFFD